jgi:hypothetical protein
MRYNNVKSHNCFKCQTQQHKAKMMMQANTTNNCKDIVLAFATLKFKPPSYSSHSTSIPQLAKTW